MKHSSDGKAFLFMILLTVLLIAACHSSHPTEPESSTTIVFDGFSARLTTDGIYLMIHLDPTWALPDSVIINTPLHDNPRVEDIEKLPDPAGLVITAPVDSVVHGQYRLVAFYRETQREYAEELRPRGDLSSYDFASIWPSVGASSVPLNPTFRWPRIDDMMGAIAIYTQPPALIPSADQVPPIFLALFHDDIDSLQVPAGVLHPHTTYYWILSAHELPGPMQAVPGTRYAYIDWDYSLGFSGSFMTGSSY